MRPGESSNRKVSTHSLLVGWHTRTHSECKVGVAGVLHPSSLLGPERRFPPSGCKEESAFLFAFCAPHRGKLMRTPGVLPPFDDGRSFTPDHMLWRLALPPPLHPSKPEPASFPYSLRRIQTCSRGLACLPRGFKCVSLKPSHALLVYVCWHRFQHLNSALGGVPPAFRAATQCR